MRVLLLGPFELLGDDDRPIPMAGGRLRALVARLAMEPGRTVPADVLTTAIWDDRPPAGGANALQALVSRVRRAVGGALLEGRPGGYRLAVSPSDVDAVRFEQLAAAGRERGDLAMLREAESLWRGPALSDLLELRFAADAAVRLERLRLSAAEERLALELAAGADVLDELRPLAAAHPLAERLQGLLIRALYAAGQQAEALAAYERTRARLADELGIDPSPELAELRLAILRQRPELTAGRRTNRTNLRAQLTSFVGREDDLARLAAAVGESRLVTVIGPGGAGKTRLAAEAAAQQQADGGVWLVELGGVTDPFDVASAVLRAIGTREVGLLEQTSHDVFRRLCEFFGAERALLVLDNCEHLVDAVAELVEGLLGACPELRVLATSRESLGVGGERLYPLTPLGLPEQAAGDPARYPAVRLFAERAAAVRPDFVLDGSNAATVAEICRRLDGLPLAIELAAARMRALSAEQIAAKLDDRFTLLTSGSRTALPRHRTLRAVIEWSWALLSEPERELAMRLAVFPGGVTLDAVVGDVDVLAGLVDKSLVERVGERYRMLETIRSYAVERLAETGREAAERAAHARYFLRLTADCDAALRTADQLTVLARLSAEHDNVLAALRFAVDGGDLDLGAGIVASMFWFWHLRGAQTERLHWTRAVLALPGEPSPELRAVVLVLRGLLRYQDGDAAGGERAVAAGVELSTRPDASGDAARPEPTLLLVAPTFLAGPAAAEVARRRERASGWERGMTLLLTADGGGSGGGDDGGPDSGGGDGGPDGGGADGGGADGGGADGGGAGGALERLEAARVEFERLGERFGLASTLRILAEHHARRGDTRAAVAALTQAATPIAELGVAADGAEVHAELAMTLTRNGELDLARTALERAWEHAEETREARTTAYVRLAHSEYLIRRGEAEAARRELALAESGFAGSELAGRIRVWCAALLALLALLDDDPPTAHRLLDTALPPSQTEPAPAAPTGMPPENRTREPLEDPAGEPAAHAAGPAPANPTREPTADSTGLAPANPTGMPPEDPAREPTADAAGLTPANPTREPAADSTGLTPTDPTGMPAAGPAGVPVDPTEVPVDPAGVPVADLAMLARLRAAAAVADGAAERAAYLVGVAAALLGTDDRRGYDGPLRTAERAKELLGEAAFQAAYDRGAALSPGAATKAVADGGSARR
ncbi:AAA family ATPase [Nonomuraea sp. NN258]|uniref:BTAD domain-containing putative transcriptional regulator n=1 Tax=Nonomuraea antri TaxID=2730852 RepID=UPI0015682F0C|nr:BTAD domain-containing putative transcriptional regulator [Nonomuraea antri]NRQ30273.1 AAA family ATPase [Nonomuraea antri]